jgi:hypothetical protein
MILYAYGPINIALSPTPRVRCYLPLAMHDRSGDPVAVDGYVWAESRDNGAALAQRRAIFVSNCWMFALWRFFTHGGFLIVSKSEWGWWPHLMWSPDMTTIHQFEPTAKKRRRLLPPLVYKGYVKETRL